MYKYFPKKLPVSFIIFSRRVKFGIATRTFLVFFSLSVKERCSLLLILEIFLRSAPTIAISCFSSTWRLLVLKRTLLGNPFFLFSKRIPTLERVPAFKLSTSHFLTFIFKDSRVALGHSKVLLLRSWRMLSSTMSTLISSHPGAFFSFSIGGSVL